MKIRSRFLVVAGAIACCSMSSNQARADQVLYSGVGILQGTQSFTDSFNLTSPGALTVSLANIALPSQLASLSLLLTSANGTLLGQETAPANGGFSVDSQTFNIIQPGNITAQWFGTAVPGGLNTGVYGLEIKFAAGSVVPLPTSVALLLSGLGLLVWQRRARNGEIPQRLGHQALEDGGDVQAI